MTVRPHEDVIVGYQSEFVGGNIKTWIGSIYFEKDTLLLKLGNGQRYNSISYPTWLFSSTSSGVTLVEDFTDTTIGLDDTKKYIWNGGEEHVSGSVMTFTSGSWTYASPGLGNIAFIRVEDVPYVFKSTGWELFGGSDFIEKDGSVPLTGNWAVNAHDPITESGSFEGKRITHIPSTFTDLSDATSASFVLGRVYGLTWIPPTEEKSDAGNFVSGAVQWHTYMNTSGSSINLISGGSILNNGIATYVGDDEDSAKRFVIPTLREGLALFNISDDEFQVYNGTSWVSLIDYLGAATKAYVDSMALGLSWKDPVLDIVTSPSGTESVGHRYIVGEGASGAFLDYDNYIATKQTVGWNFANPSEGWACWVEDENYIYTYNGSSWVKVGSTPVTSVFEYDAYGDLIPTVVI